jgi:hypothetical protein
MYDNVKFSREEKMRLVLLSLMTFFPLFAVNIIDCTIEKVEPNKLYITLSLDDNWNGTFTQKQDGNGAVFVFNGLGTEISSQVSYNSSLINKLTLRETDKAEAQLSLQSERIFDISVEIDDIYIHLTLVPQSIPLSIEGIAKDASSGEIIAVALDALLYIVIFLAILTGGFFVFVKFKLLPYSRAKNIPKTDESKEEAFQDDENTSIDDIVTEESSAQNQPVEIKQEQNTSVKEQKTTPKPITAKIKKQTKTKMNTRKADKAKSLFDM